MIFVPIHYFYLVLSLSFVVVWAVLYAINGVSARRKMLSMGAWGAVLGPLSELIYFRDYWMPESVFSIRIGTFPLMFEDILLGFAMFGIAGVLYEMLFHMCEVPLGRDAAERYGRLAMCVVWCGVLAFLLVLGLNSIYASSVAFLLAATPMLWFRRDLIPTAFVSGIGFMAVMFTCYFILLQIMINEEAILQNVWFLYHTTLDYRIVGIPITEMAWGFSVGFFMGILHPYLQNKKWKTR